MVEHVDVGREGPILRVTLVRPEKKNALTSAMYEALIRALEAAEADTEIRVILLAGSGGAFCAGNDIADFPSDPADFLAAPSLRFIRALAACRVPLVAAVEGAAVGIGTTLLLHCDLVYAAPDAIFRLPFVDLGLVPEAASSLLLPRRVGLARASELLLLGRAFGASEASSFGLVNAVIPSPDLIAHAAAQAHALARKPAGALAETRRLLRGDPAEILKRIDIEAERFAAALGGAEARAAIAAFLNRSKSPPD